jgi:hypothetical protein
MRMHYWAVRPKGDVALTRIERADGPIEAIVAAYGRGLDNPRVWNVNIGLWEAKDLGTRVSVLHSDSKRIALLKSPEGWFDPFRRADPPKTKK